jgi:Sulfotransferase domain
MLFIAFGTHGSGSTWIFNAIRLLAMHARLPLAVSLYSDGGIETLRNIPSGTQNVVVKAHRTDHILMTLASLVETKIIISMRDPRDSVVSLFERFSISTREAVAWLSASFASLASLPTTADRLVFHYEDRFTENVATISAIAKFVGLDVTDDETGAMHRRGEIAGF